MQEAYPIHIERKYIHNNLLVTIVVVCGVLCVCGCSVENEQRCNEIAVLCRLFVKL